MQTLKKKLLYSSVSDSLHGRFIFLRNIVDGFEGKGYDCKMVCSERVSVFKSCIGIHVFLSVVKILLVVSGGDN